MGRLLALDYGSKTVGMAISDPLKLIASPYGTIKREKEGQLRPTLRRITDIVAGQDVEAIILGYPLNMDSSRGERAEKTEAFRTLIEKRLRASELDIPVILWDERLSTVGADEILYESGVPGDERKQYIDSIAAALILEDYMKNGGKGLNPAP